ncbi:peroxidase, family 2 domain-containing protein [Trichoderma breve]|uniref:Peroxidase, family 2 domain-containing protein n=1 Tax=Trichoderma breve TaxID=2034170 RepID=A0A9W9B707_9HYPO|nr:peroxidase, family 2 domain-containing protein [Trichoderma breve]KAJ4855819.1 peroxidase, family 2 domain-containing protein [Trichoderma breve]
MKFLLSLVGISTLSNIGAAQLLGLPPIFDAFDPKFDDWQPAGPDDSRGPCPGLNSLANHGFLPHSGKNITVIDIVRGTYLGLGLSPEASVAVGVAELIKSYRLAAFDLHELSNHGFVEHDCSLSRADFGDGNNNDFNETIWSARDLFDIAHNPNQQCGARSIAVGALENGLLIQSLGGKPPLEWVRSIFEQQRIPTNLGFRPEPIVLNNLAGITAVGLTSLVSQPNLTYLLGNTVIKTPADLLAEVFPVKEYDLTYILEVLGLAGFPSVDLSFLTGA